MPNWCENHVHFSHKNKEMIEIIKNSEKQGLFNTFFPIKMEDKFCEPKLEDAIREWGTKWDVEEFQIVDSGDNHIVLNFVTAWSPPIEFYDKMCEIGFQIDALFHENGCAVLGSYTNEHGVQDYPYPESPEDYEELPDEFEHAFGLYSYWEDHGVEQYAENL